MEKRTKILLIILGVLAVAAAGFYGYGMFFGGSEEQPPQPVMAAKKPPAPAPQQAPAQAKAPVAQPGKPAAASPAKTAAPQSKAVPAAQRPGPPSKAAPSVNEGQPQEPAQKIYTYASMNKRDPFMDPTKVPKVFPPIPPNAKPFERFPIEQIALKAVLWNNKGFRAMVVTPDGRGYTVKVGDHLGDKRGRITKITERRLYVTEKIPDVLGDVETKNTILQLHKEAE